jgi:predicted secreted protein
MMHGDKTKLLRGDGAEIETFIEVAEILEIGDITITRDMSVSPPTFDSIDNYETAIPGAKKVEPIELKVKYTKDAAIAALINADFESDDPVNYQIHWPNDPQTKKQISVFVNKISISTPQFADVTESFTFTPNGKVTDVV